MLSENGIFLLFCIFLSHGNERKKRGVGCKKGRCCVLSTSTCESYEGVFIDEKYNLKKAVTGYLYAVKLR